RLPSLTPASSCGSGHLTVGFIFESVTSPIALWVGRYQSRQSAAWVEEEGLSQKPMPLGKPEDMQTETQQLGW
ncbi:hypothetical protein, partial [Stenomitos frigidus]|uniref:hypothetical protein n=1 Tax=Stenomitos frigidus TaxID=1886765 RepID=UPI001C62C26E